MKMYVFAASIAIAPLAFTLAVKTGHFVEFPKSPNLRDRVTKWVRDQLVPGARGARGARPTCVAQSRFNQIICRRLRGGPVGLMLNGQMADIPFALPPPSWLSTALSFSCTQPPVGYGSGHLLTLGQMYQLMLMSKPVDNNADRVHLILECAAAMPPEPGSATRC
ncbi:unnamed protein product [Protopolystoma xenopodis]|uniref:Uncharacterized protein n=1 Tax=Protopolystoma xenopodis TaxID=117903 RepID=A0A448WCE4_9PLAT|nr:unnamed protein product [Protopolystoma xenopodis]